MVDVNPETCALKTQRYIVFATQHPMHLWKARHIAEWRTAQPQK
jgi:hypothetical protein